MDASQSIRKGSPVRRRGASASNCESGVRGAGNGKPPDGWSEGSARVENGCLAYSVRFPTADFQSSISERQYPQTIFRLEPLEFSQ